MSPTPVKKADRAMQGQCDECGQTYTKRQYYQRFCSQRCRSTAYWTRRITAKQQQVNV